MSRIVYKVVNRQSDGSLVSVMQDRRVRITYKPNVKTFGKLFSGVPSKVFAFDSLDAAEQYRCGCKSQEIWKCTANGVCKLLPANICDFLGNRKEFWKIVQILREQKKSVLSGVKRLYKHGRSSSISYLYAESISSHCFGCDNITLLEKVC